MWSLADCVEIDLSYKSTLAITSYMICLLTLGDFHSRLTIVSPVVNICDFLDMTSPFTIRDIIPYDGKSLLSTNNCGLTSEPLSFMDAISISNETSPTEIGFTPILYCLDSASF